MSRYADDYTCTCEMQLVCTKNDQHADSCELWQEETFRNGSDEWDGSLGTLVLNRNPWDRPGDYVWDGDNPIVSIDTAIDRMAETVSDDVPIGALEQEALDCLTAGSAEVDESGWILLPDGSFADFESRMTYRKINDQGQVYWADESWDDEDIALAEPVDCVCTPSKKFYCQVCRVQRLNESDQWMPWDGKYNAVPSNGTTYYYSSCHHVFETFHLPKRQHRNIKISGKRFHTPDTTPDYGLYAYDGWSPSCVATFIPWADYGLPKTAYASAARAIVDAWNRACNGEKVEVGCMGGHGRTGTILACLAILSDPEMSAEDAVLHVRKVHCHEAIETNQQEWFVAWFRAWHLGCTPPPMPQTYVSKHSATWDAAKTAATAVAARPYTAPKVLGTPEYRSVGPASNGTYCAECKRPVIKYHNGGCSQDTIPAVPTIEQLRPTAGETANARRRNAKRANRRAAKREMARIRTGD